MEPAGAALGAAGRAAVADARGAAAVAVVAVVAGSVAARGAATTVAVVAARARGAAAAVAVVAVVAPSARGAAAFGGSVPLARLAVGVGQARARGAAADRGAAEGLQDRVGVLARHPHEAHPLQDPDRADDAPRQPALARDGADDVAGADPVDVPHREHQLHLALARRRRALAAALGWSALAGLARAAVEARLGLGLGLERERPLAPGDPQRRGGDLGRVEPLAHQAAHQLQQLVLLAARQLAHALEQPLAPAVEQLGAARHPHGLHALARVALDALQQPPLARLPERDRAPLTAGPPGAPDPVDVDLLVERHVVVDDEVDVLHVEPARGHVGRDHDLHAPLAQARHDDLPLGLAHAAVDRLGAMPVRLEPLGQLGAGALGAHEHQHRLVVLGLEHPLERLPLLAGRHARGELGDARDGERLVLDPDVGGVAQVALGHAPDRAGQGGREQRHLPLGGRVLEDPLHVVDEPHLEHLVGLVEAEEAHAAEVERPALEVVLHPPRRADHHVHPAAQRAELDPDRLAPVDREHLHAALAEAAAVGPHGLAHLQRQLAGRHQHDRLHPVGVGVEVVQQGQREGGGLARAGLGLAEQVAPGEERGDRASLDRRRLLVAELLEGAQQRRREPELGEGGLALGSGRRRGRRRRSGLRRGGRLGRRRLGCGLVAGGLCHEVPVRRAAAEGSR